MDLFWQISLTLFGAVSGAVVSLILPMILNYKRYKRRPDLLGSWKSVYRSDYREQMALVTEDVEVDLHFGRLVCEIATIKQKITILFMQT